jgi:DNA-directed RNA polymerase specialized sigma24 family protein
VDVAADRSEDRSDTGLDAAVRRHQAWLVGRIALVVGDREEARDLAQQTFVRAAERWPIGSDKDVARWLPTITEVDASGGSDDEVEASWMAADPHSMRASKAR